jgi:16S rRNA A1518/A1519 N6-dimethyltransferase RsmA/KsgA/DIM1 with predicted DNA glycosylase/AP lyase activity
MHREAFFPVPHVDSAFAEFLLRAPENGMDEGTEEEFVQFVANVFQTKRKTLMNNLRRHFPEQGLQSCLESLGLSSGVRAETLSVDDLLQLFACLRDSGKCA